MSVDADEVITNELGVLLARLDRARGTNIGFPGATDFDYGPLAPFFTSHLLNNVGDPYTDGVAANHTKALEREVVTLHPRGIVYASEAAHPACAKAVDLLAMRSIMVRADDSGEVDYADLRTQIGRRRDRPAIVVATIGTTMSEAVDDVRRITSILDALAVRRRFVHADAALSGIPLALLDPAARPGLDFADGADSAVVSGHKFIGAPMPCAVVVVKASHQTRATRSVAYTGSPDTTISGSRSGHAPLLLWYALRRHGIDGLRRRAQACRDLAAYTHRRLVEVGWEARRNPHAFTVVLRTPPAAVTDRWVLASNGGWSHIVCMPGITREHIDAFVAALAAARDSTTTPAAPRSNGRRTAVPRPVRPAAPTTVTP